ncbi:hypothetical protein DPMN_192582 [Dreissena polymorpha]|uniref:Uncharacterized protein n=1 Tax=Dreissena polymorpha TaxID=45954 RepID=A0A9D3Y4P4_DREPO|nr:hypothetical protein DPMN_192582 [Dreissena polymorpha]
MLSTSTVFFVQSGNNSVNSTAHGGDAGRNISSNSNAMPDDRHRSSMSINNSTMVDVADSGSNFIDSDSIQQSAENGSSSNSTMVDDADENFSSNLIDSVLIQQLAENSSSSNSTMVDVADENSGSNLPDSGLIQQSAENGSSLNSTMVDIADENIRSSLIDSVLIQQLVENGSSSNLTTNDAVDENIGSHTNKLELIQHTIETGYLANVTSGDDADGNSTSTNSMTSFLIAEPPLNDSLTHFTTVDRLPLNSNVTLMSSGNSLLTDSLMENENENLSKEYQATRANHVTDISPLKEFKTTNILLTTLKKIIKYYETWIGNAITRMVLFGRKPQPESHLKISKAFAKFLHSNKTTLTLFSGRKFHQVAFDEIKLAGIMNNRTETKNWNDTADYTTEDIETNVFNSSTPGLDRPRHQFNVINKDMSHHEGPSNGNYSFNISSMPTSKPRMLSVDNTTTGGDFRSYNSI